MKNNFGKFFDSDRWITERFLPFFLAEEKWRRSIWRKIPIESCVSRDSIIDRYISTRGNFGGRGGGGLFAREPYFVFRQRMVAIWKINSWHRSLPRRFLSSPQRRRNPCGRDGWWSQNFPPLELRIVANLSNIYIYFSCIKY